MVINTVLKDIQTKGFEVVKQRKSGGEYVSGVLISDRLSDNDQSCSYLKTKVFSQDPIRPKANMTSSKLSTDSNQVNADSSIDQKLVARVKKGDKKAFDLLVVKYQGRVASIISRYVSDYHEVADVTQETFIKAYRAIERFRGDSAFYTWIYRIAINCAKNYLQAKGRRPPSFDVDVNDAQHLTNASRLKEVASPEAFLEKDQLEKVIKQALDSLPEDLRVALTLREFDHLSYDDIAEIMACPVGTVRSRIFRAREVIDKEISAMRDN